MPIKGRGKVIRYRTIALPHHKGYIHIEVVSKAGPHGGHTVSGPVHKYKKRTKKHAHHSSHLHHLVHSGTAGVKMYKAIHKR